MEPIERGAHKEFLDSQFIDLRLVSLYLLSTGRNAWHSTWSEKYRRNAALFSTFESAKSVAEKARNRGTTFEIEQIPGLAFYSLEGVAAVVEFHSKPSFNKLKIDKAAINLKIGRSIGEALVPFISAESEYWERPFPSVDSFVAVKSDLAEDFEPIPEAVYFKRWSSVSHGSNFYLSWNEKNKPIETPINRIFSEFINQNSTVEIEESKVALEKASLLAADKRRSKEESQRKFEEASQTLSELLKDRASTRNDEVGN